MVCFSLIFLKTSTNQNAFTCIFQDQRSELEVIKADAKLLFDLADDDKSGSISEIEWLHGWAQTIHQTGTAQFVDGFIATSMGILESRGIDKEHIGHVMSLGLSVLPRIFTWVHNAKEQVAANKNKNKK